MAKGHILPVSVLPRLQWTRKAGMDMGYDLHHSKVKAFS